jgi:hypothetical protein
MRYARAEFGMKQQAPQQAFPNVALSANDKVIVGYDGGMLGSLSSQ